MNYVSTSQNYITASLYTFYSFVERYTNQHKDEKSTNYYLIDRNIDPCCL